MSEGLYSKNHHPVILNLFQELRGQAALQVIYLAAGMHSRILSRWGAEISMAIIDVCNGQAQSNRTLYRAVMPGSRLLRACNDKSVIVLLKTKKPDKA